MSDQGHDSQPPDDTAILDAEYALGVLTAGERREAERRAAHDTAFAQNLAQWQRLLTPLADTVAPITPPPAVWRRIEAAIGPDHQAARQPDRRAGLWQSLSFWRGFAFGSLALAAASFAAYAIVLPERDTTGQLVVESATRGGPAGIIAAFDPKERTLLIVPAAPSASQQWVPELWLILPSGASRSLGVVNPGQPAEVSLPAELADQAGAQPNVAISLEPPGGSPTGVPTGPVIAEGTLHRL